MEQTLGKRIMQHRKRLGLTQDQLAEKLGVTAQAVSKWENDISCPDIAMLPKLAELFSISIDALLGRSEPTVHEAEVITEEADNGIHISDPSDGHWEFTYDNSKASAVTFAAAVLLVGIVYFAARLLRWDVTLWQIIWPSALLVIGISGLIKRFRFFSFGCALAGLYFLLDNLKLLPFGLNGELLVPAIIIACGIALLLDAVKKPKKPKFHFSYSDGDDGDGHRMKNTCDINGEDLNYTASFGEATQTILMDRLSSGSISTSFGEFTVDLSEVKEVAEPCEVSANCSFGELTLLVPRRFCVKSASSTAFASVQISGHPAPDAVGTIYLDANASFGEISIRYI